MSASEHEDFADPDAVLRLWYERYYSIVAVTANGSFFQRYMHAAMERPFGPSDRFSHVLEVGGNHGEHVPFVRHAFDRYVLSDLRLPVLSPDLSADGRVQVQACNIEALPYPDQGFDRLISTCVLHHVDQPYTALREVRRVVRTGGAVTFLLPTDPGMSYRAARALTSGRGARRHGVASLHRLVGALDHRNHFPSLYDQIRYVFRGDHLQVRWHPWRLPSWNLNAFAVIQIRLR